MSQRLRRPVPKRVAIRRIVCHRPVRMAVSWRGYPFVATCTMTMAHLRVWR